MQDISLPTDLIASNYQRWKRNRDLIAGEDTVKQINAGYLPRIDPIHDYASFPATANDSYKKYLSRSPFFPASSRILDGIMGMVFRKPVRLEASTALTPIMETITEDSLTVDDLAEEVAKEVFTTGYAGLLVDHPQAKQALSLAEAQKVNARPFVRTYAAEAILEVTAGVVLNKRKLMRVRVMDNPDTIREMVIGEDGFYAVIFHDNKEGVWLPRDPIWPTRAGQKLTDIPFVVVSTKARAIAPVKAVMDDICLLNIQLFRAQANSASLMHYCANPILGAYGIAPTDLKVSLGTILFFPDHSTEKPNDLKYTQASNEGQESLDNAVQRIKDELSAVGSRIIAPDGKAGVESAEALTLRKANENSVLASYVKTISRGIKEALDWVAWWMNQPEVDFALSTDFLPTAMTPQERVQVVNEWQKGLYSHDTALKLLIDGEILPPDFDVEAEITKANEESAAVDRPLNDQTLSADQEPTGDDGE